MADEIALQLVARYDGKQAEKGLSNLSKGVKQAEKDSKDLGTTVREHLTKEIAKLGGVSQGVSGQLVRQFGAMRTQVLAATGAVIGFGLAIKGINALDNAQRAQSFRNQRFNSLFPDGSARQVAQTALAYGRSAREVEQAAIALAVATGDAHESLKNLDLIYRTSSKKGLDFADSRKVVAAAIRGEREEVERLIPQMRGLQGETIDALRSLGGSSVNVGGGVGAAAGNLFSAGKERFLDSVGSSPTLMRLEITLNALAQAIRGDAGPQGEFQYAAGSVLNLSGSDIAKLRKLEAEQRKLEIKRLKEADEAARRARARRDIIGDMRIDDTIGRSGGVRRDTGAVDRPFSMMFGQLPGRSDVAGFMLETRRNAEEARSKKAEKDREEFRAGLAEDVEHIQNLASGLKDMFVGAFSAAANGGDVLKSVLIDLRDNVISSLGKSLAQALAPLLASNFGPFGGILAGAITGNGFNTPANAGASNARTDGLTWRAIRNG